MDRTEYYTHIRYYWWILNEWNNTWIWLVQLHKLAESRSVFVWILRSQKTTACVMMIWLKFEPSSRLMRVKLVQYFTVGVCVYWQSKEKQKYHVEWKEIWDMEKLESFNNVSGPSNRHHLVPLDYLTWNYSLQIMSPIGKFSIIPCCWWLGLIVFSINNPGEHITIVDVLIPTVVVFVILCPTRCDFGSSLAMTISHCGQHTPTNMPYPCDSYSNLVEHTLLFSIVYKRSHNKYIYTDR